MKQKTRHSLIRAGAAAAIGYFALLALLALNEDSIVFVGSNRGYARHPIPAETARMPWDSLRVRAADGVPVFLIESRLDSSGQGPWTIFFHGNGALAGSPHNIARYRLLREVGFNVLAVEYRGYGMSRHAGEVSEEGVYEDARAAWAYLTERLEVEPSRIVVYGISLGSGVATKLASEVEPAGLITEGAFTSAPDVGSDVYPFFPVSLIMQNRFDNLQRARSLTIPWLIFHSRNDEVIPFSHGETLAEAAANVRFVELQGSHSGGVIREVELARAELERFAESLFELER